MYLEGKFTFCRVVMVEVKYVLSEASQALGAEAFVSALARLVSMDDSDGSVSVGSVSSIPSCILSSH